jgi:acyl carrier protein
MNESEIRRQLRDWILKRSKNPPKGSFTDTTEILEEGILSSLDVVEFVLYIESLRGDEVDTDAIEPEAFTSIDTLYATFFGAA